MPSSPFCRLHCFACYLSIPFKALENICFCMRAHTHTHTHHPCLILRANRFASLNVQQAGLNNQNILKQYVTRWAEDHIKFKLATCITTLVAMAMQDKPETCISAERSHLQKSAWCS